MPFVQFEPQQVRSGAGKLRRLGPDAKRVPPDVDRSADTADSANKGFMTGEACQAIAKGFKDTMKELQEHLEDTADLLEDIADDWEESDRSNAGDFDGIGDELSALKLPGM